jgi:hypothetical protein
MDCQGNVEMSGFVITLFFPNSNYYEALDSIFSMDDWKAGNTFPVDSVSGLRYINNRNYQEREGDPNERTNPGYY